MRKKPDQVREYELGQSRTKGKNMRLGESMTKDWNIEQKQDHGQENKVNSKNMNQGKGRTRGKSI